MLRHHAHHRRRRLVAVARAIRGHVAPRHAARAAAAIALDVADAHHHIAHERQLLTLRPRARPHPRARARRAASQLDGPRRVGRALMQRVAAHLARGAHAAQRERRGRAVEAVDDLCRLWPHLAARVRGSATGSEEDKEE